MIGTRRAKDSKAKEKKMGTTWGKIKEKNSGGKGPEQWGTKVRKFSTRGC